MKKNIFIEHPYWAIVISSIILLCGVLAIQSLPITQYPNITPPQINVTTQYPGASAKTILQTVVVPLEEQINGVDNLIYLESDVADSGQVSLTATFAIGSDPVVCVQNVQDRVQWALSQLPETVQKEGLVTQQKSGNITLAVSLFSAQNSYNSLFLSNYASINLVQKLKRIDGVADVVVFGSSDYAMRIWLDPIKMAALSVTPQEVIKALQQQNMQVASGAIGAAPQADNQMFRYNIETQGRRITPTEFENIIVKTDQSGATVFVKDIARVELGAEDYESKVSINASSGVMVLIYQKSTANGLKISEECRKLMEKEALKFPPDLEYAIQYDSTNFVRISIQDVIITLSIAILLVAIVVMIFLQNWRMAIIPIIAIPVSVIGAFVILFILGYSINLITLFALILAIGIVVDDAIIVIENVSRLIEEEGLSPKEATVKAMQQITGAIMATTAVLLAMFVPICFISGITGELYREFGVTLSAAVVISALNALTLSPALSSIILKDTPKKEGWFARLFNSILKKITSFYLKILHLILNYRLISVTLFLIIASLSIYFYANIPKGFIPNEDQGYFFVSVQLPSGSALERTANTTKKVVKIMENIAGVKDVISFPGFNLLDGIADANNAFLIAILEPWSERTTPNTSIGYIIDKVMFESYETIPEAMVIAFEAPAIPGIGKSGGFNFVLQLPNSVDANRLHDYLNKTLFAAMKSPDLRNVFSSFTVDTPGLYLNVDREKARQMGVSIEDINETIESFTGVNYVNNFNMLGQIYQVELQANSNSIRAPQDLLQLYVKGGQGDMVPLSSLATVERTVGASILRRYNLALAAEIQGSPAPNRSSAQAMEKMAEIANATLPEDMTFSWTNISYQEAKSGTSSYLIYLLALLFIFLFLTALYDSFLLPWSVVLSVPLALGGAAILINHVGYANNIYTQIGVILLFGMSCKTSILIVDFAKQNRDSGKDLNKAVTSAVKMRFRAIIMTGFAFILGTLPLLFAQGAGAASQRSIGASVVGGMSSGIILVVLFIPLFFVICRGLSEFFSKEN